MIAARSTDVICGRELGYITETAWSLKYKIDYPIQF